MFLSMQHFNPIFSTNEMSKIKRFASTTSVSHTAFKSSADRMANGGSGVIVRGVDIDEDDDYHNDVVDHNDAKQSLQRKASIYHMHTG